MAVPVRARQCRPTLAPQRGNTSPSKQLSETFARAVKKFSRYEECRLSVATRQIALSTITGTASVTPNFAVGMQTAGTIPNTYQPCFVTRSVLSLAVGRGFRCRMLAMEEKTIRTPVKNPPTNSTLLEMLAPKSHTSSAQMDMRSMKERAMWRTGYVDTVHLRSHMPTMKIR